MAGMSLMIFLFELRLNRSSLNPITHLAIADHLWTHFFDPVANYLTSLRLYLIASTGASQGSLASIKTLFLRQSNS